MTGERDEMPSIGLANEPDVCAAQKPGPPEFQLERLTPLIHDLLTWELVRRSDTGRFELREDVQQRLEELSAGRSLHTADVYVGRRCERCGALAVTRLVGGMRTCSSCSSALDQPTATIVEVAPAPDTPPVPARSRWHHKAG
ncbi:MAG: hypothetical protein ACLQPH_20590 [Acidimicrobiales bacterium]